MIVGFGGGGDIGIDASIIFTVLMYKAILFTNSTQALKLNNKNTKLTRTNGLHWKHRLPTQSEAALGNNTDLSKSTCTRVFHE